MDQEFEILQDDRSVRRKKYNQKIWSGGSGCVTCR